MKLCPNGQATFSLIFYDVDLRHIRNTVNSVPSCSPKCLSCGYYTESFIYYARQQTAVAPGLAWPARRFMGRQTAAARRHTLRFSVTVIPVIL